LVCFALDFLTSIAVAFGGIFVAAGVRTDDATVLAGRLRSTIVDAFA
jgi:hypothetical protein